MGKVLFDTAPPPISQGTDVANINTRPARYLPPPRWLKRTSVILFASLIAFGPLLFGQAPKGVARIALGAPPTVVAGQQGTVAIRLLNAAGQPTAADADMKLHVDALGAVVDHQTITIPKGATSAQVGVSKERPGTSDIRVEQIDDPTGGFKANAQIGFLPSDTYTPVSPLSLWLSVQPNAKLKAGVETAKIIVRYIDSQKVSIPARRSIQVAFPGLADKISPYPLRIPSGAPFGEATLTDNRAEIIPLNPVPSPPISIISDANSVEFVSPIVGLRLIADPSYSERVRHPKIALKIGLVDVQGNWIASDKDRTVLLRVEPSTGGVLGKVEVTIPKGNSVAETTFAPAGEGKSTIKAIVGEGLIVEPAEIEFKYASPYFWLLAALGGLIGGGVRNAIGADHSIKKVLLQCGGGIVTGLLTYLLLPLIVSLSLKPVDLQTSSKVFEAFLWGFIGGGSGIALLGKILSSVQSSSAAQGPR